jgi:hypothetical protein
MAYDAAHDLVVLFGGQGSGGDPLADTWTWNGSDWTKLSPVHSPSPRYDVGMAYDAARQQIVLFGGRDADGTHLGDTWTWDGADWTEQSPAHSPPARIGLRLAYDSDQRHVLLFGGDYFLPPDTWTWDGTDWTQRSPTHSPKARAWEGMAYDAAHGEVVMFGGKGDCTGCGPHYGDTWTWDGIDWSTHGSIKVSPSSGPPGTIVRIRGWGFGAGVVDRLEFLDSAQGKTFLQRVTTDGSGAFSLHISIPVNASPGRQRVKAKAVESGAIAKRRFTVT